LSTYKNNKVLKDPLLIFLFNVLIKKSVVAVTEFLARLGTIGITAGMSGFCQQLISWLLCGAAP